MHRVYLRVALSLYNLNLSLSPSLSIVLCLYVRIVESQLLGDRLYNPSVCCTLGRRVLPGLQRSGPYARLKNSKTRPACGFPTHSLFSNLGSVPTTRPPRSHPISRIRKAQFTTCLLISFSNCFSCHKKIIIKLFLKLSIKGLQVFKGKKAYFL